MGNYQCKEYFMKKVFRVKALRVKAIRRIAGIISIALAIAFSFAACDDGSTGGGGSGGGGGRGTFTLTGIPAKYNGMYADMLSSDIGLGIYSTNGDPSARISNGTVRIPVYTINTNYTGSNDLDIPFTGSGTGRVAVTISTKSDSSGDIMAFGTFSSVTFSNGSATASWNQVDWTER
jgi:hypothetical protein